MIEFESMQIKAYCLFLTLAVGESNFNSSSVKKSENAVNAESQWCKCRTHLQNIAHRLSESVSMTYVAYLSFMQISMA